MKDRMKMYIKIRNILHSNRQSVQLTSSSYCYWSILGNNGKKRGRSTMNIINNKEEDIYIKIWRRERVEKSNGKITTTQQIPKGQWKTYNFKSQSSSSGK